MFDVFKEFIGKIRLPGFHMVAVVYNLIISILFLGITGVSYGVSGFSIITKIALGMSFFSGFCVVLSMAVVLFQMAKDPKHYLHKPKEPKP